MTGIWTSSRRRARGRRGFGILLVIIAMAMAAAAVLVMGALFVHEAKRTQAVAASGQLRQLLLAAVPAARGELAQHGEQEREVRVAVPVDGAVLTLHITPGGDGAQVRASASMGKFRAVQELTFRRSAPESWKLMSARLVQMVGE